MKENYKSSSLEGIGKVIPAILLMFVVIGVGLGGMRYLNSLKNTQVQASTATSATDEILVSIQDTGDIVLNEKVIPLAELEARMKKIATGLPDQAVIIRAGGETEYRRVTEVLDKVKSAGIWNVAFASES